MTTVCLIVIGISGLFCYDAEPVGTCLRTPNGRLCIAHETDLPLFLSVYDPAICNEHPTNCLDPATAWQSATGMMTPDDYRRVAACPVDWLWRKIEVAGMSLECRDTGGRIHPMYREFWNGTWGWVIVIDVLFEHHLYGWPEWSLQAWEVWNG